MKGIILCGGLGTRLSPLTMVQNKHLLPVYDKPMICYPINTLVSAGITDINVIVSGPFSGNFLPFLKNGEDFGCKISYTFQEKADGGIADALSLTEGFAAGQDVCVILGDNTTDADLRPALQDWDESYEYGGGLNPRAHIFYKEVEDPSSFGVIEYIDLPKGVNKISIKSIIEKPENPPSNHAVTGVYIYDRNVYDFIKMCKPSERGQLEITDVNNIYLKEGKITCTELKGYWQDAGTFNNLLKANNYWSKKDV